MTSDTEFLNRRWDPFCGKELNNDLLNIINNGPKDGPLNLPNRYYIGTPQWSNAWYEIFILAKKAIDESK